MVTRVYFDDPEPADEAAHVLYEAGHEVAVIKERFAGEDDDEDVSYVLATPAPEETVRTLLTLDDDAWVETDE